MKSTIITASDARSDLFNLIRSASKGLREHIIKLQGEKPVVMLSLEEYESLKETAEILSIPGAKESILKGARDIKAGRGIPLSKLK